MTNVLDFGVLGTLEVHRNGSPVRLSSARQRSLLAALLIRGDRPVSADALVDAIWGEHLPASPRSALHTVISRLRGTLGDDAIDHGPDGYRLVRRPEDLDATRFETLCAQASDVAIREARDLLDQALALWRGRAYAEFADRDFATAEANRLDELRLTCIEDRAELELKVGEPEAVAATMEGFVTEHPLRERARGLLMTALYRSGRATEALQGYQDYRKQLADQLGLEPSPKLRALEVSILNHDLPDVAEVKETPDPWRGWRSSDTVFLGRDDDVANLIISLRTHRLVTLTGVGGVGKTRLAAETLPLVVADPDLPPVTVVELGDVDSREAEAAIAAALGVGQARGDLGKATIEYLSITPTFLVLDNCEHVLDAVRSFVGSALRQCPGLRLLATSRQRIGLPAEQVFPVPPLAAPDVDTSSSDPELTAAMRLFVDRARRVRPSFDLRSTDLDGVAEVCRRLDGLPLAIELAATRAATWGIEPLRQRLDQSLSLLEDDGERSLRATLEWSHDLLDASGQRLFALLAVFEGDFDLEAAEAVAGGLGLDTVAVVLARLVDASLVISRMGAPNRRYRMLETVRAFAREHLSATGIEDEVRRNHALWLRSIVESVASASVAPGKETLTRLVALIPNVRSAVSWAIDAGEMALAGEITGSLTLAFPKQGGLHAIDLVRRVGEDPGLGDTTAEALARAAAGVAAAWQGDLVAAEGAGRAALAKAHTRDERFLAICSLGIAMLYAGDHDASRRWWHELLAIEGLPPDHRLQAHASLALIACYRGDVSEATGHADRAKLVAKTASGGIAAFASYAVAEVAAVKDLPSAVPLLVEAADEATEVGAEFVAGVSSTALLAALTRLGRHHEAREVLGPLIDRWLRLAAWPQMWTTMRLTAELLAAEDDHGTAALLLMAADHAPSAPAVTENDADRYAQLAAVMRDRLGVDTYEEIETIARSLPRTQIVERARTAVSAPRSDSRSDR